MGGNRSRKATIDRRDPGLEARVADALADDGALARTMRAFEPRAGQRRMAAAAARVLENGGVLLAEAGTGTGKTLAYLVPAILSGQRVLVSTGTKNLQDQIFYKDLPDLRNALGVDFRATYMKGRGNYLCLHRFATACAEAAGALPLAERSVIEQIAEWADRTETGDRAEIEDLPDNLAVWNDVAATSENCIGTECPAYQECFVTKMRQRAAESDVVIVNHHLLCADAAVRQSAYGEVIPACAVAVIDEAHQLEDVATQYFGIAVSNHRLDELYHDGRRFVAGDAAPEIDLEEASVRELLDLLDGVRSDAHLFFGALAPAAAAGERTRVTADALSGVAEPARRLGRRLGDLAAAASRLAEPAGSTDLAALGRRADELRTELAFLLAAGDAAYVYFVERRGRGLFLRAAPIDVSSIIRELLIERMESTVLTLRHADGRRVVRVRPGTPGHRRRHRAAAAVGVRLPRAGHPVPAAGDAAAEPPPVHGGRGERSHRTAADHQGTRVRSVHQLREPARRARPTRSDAAVSAAGAGRLAAQRPPARVPRHAQRRAAGDLELLAGGGRRRRRTELRRDRQAAVRLSGRPP